jgi:hypothetical protein
MARSRRFLAASVIAVALAAACTNQDADGDDVAAALEDAGLDPEQADCVGDGLEDELEGDSLNEVRDADELSDLDDELETTVNSVLDQCLNEGGGSDAEGDTTETTEATDDATTTTEG